MTGGTYYIPDPDKDLRELSSRRDRDEHEQRRRGRSRGNRTRRRRWLWILLLLPFLVLGLAWVFRVQILVQTSRFLDVSETIYPADYVFVDAGVPNVRPFYGAALYRAGLAGAVLLSHPEPTTDVLAGIEPPEDELTRDILIEEGVYPIDIIFLPGEVTSTLDEAYALAGFLAEHPNAQVTVLTSDFHTRRTRYHLHKVLTTEAKKRVRMLGVPHPDFTSEDWWRSRPGLMYHAGELIKLVYYWLM